MNLPIKHKRGTTVPTANDLVVGELAINTATGVVYTKTGAGNVVAIGMDVAAVWGNIGGTLSDQTDLQNALDAKYDASNPNNYIPEANTDGNLYGRKNGQWEVVPVTDLTGYATETYVTSQGYITSAALSGYATETYVSNQGYLVSSNIPGLVPCYGNLEASAYYIPASARPTGTQTYNVYDANLGYNTDYDLTVQAPSGSQFEGFDVYVVADGSYGLVTDFFLNTATFHVGITDCVSAFGWLNTNIPTWTFSNNLSTALYVQTTEISATPVHVVRSTSALPTTTPFVSKETLWSDFTDKVNALAGISKVLATDQYGDFEFLNQSYFAPATSPNLLGTPYSTTPAVDNNTQRIATTAYVIGQAASTTPAMNGTAAAGSSTRWSRADHVHPSDTSRAALAGATFTGKVNTTATATTAPLNIGGSATAPTATIAGDIWIGTNINFKDNTAGTTKVVANTNTTNTFNSPQVIDTTSNTLPGLRVTQKGTAASFIVEDQLNPDGNAFVVDASGNVGIGVDIAYVAVHKLEVVGAIKATSITFDGTKQFKVSNSQSNPNTGTLTGVIYPLEMLVSYNGSTYAMPMRLVSTP